MTNIFEKLTGQSRDENEPPLETRDRIKPKENIEPIEIDRESAKVYILESILDYNLKGGDLVPNPKKFRHFTLDQRTLETIEKITTAAELRDPCLLEGKTSTSKTSSIEYLAMCLNQEVVRLNLNGQTDTSELIGKFIPNDGQLQIKFEQLLKHPELLSALSLQIVQKANKEGRGISLLEAQKIAKAEDIDVPDWRWQDGIVPKAMETGQWVILDEINLAEPQILERLNSVLERHPSLVLSEHGGDKIEEGSARSLDHHFRIFATMNPAEYAGRAAMSPAYKDRWTSYMFVGQPNEKDYLAMSEHLVYGTQPKVEINGIKYQAPEVEPLFENISQIPNFRNFLARLSKLQVKLEQMSEEREIGKGRKEKYIFTRRGLIEFFEYLSQKTIVNRQSGKTINIKSNPKEVILRAIKYYFIDKMANPDDVKRVQDLMDAIGISEENWTLEFSTKAAKKMDKDLKILDEELEKTTESGSFKEDESVKIKEGSSHSSHDGETGVILSLEKEKITVRVGGCTHDFPIEELIKVDKSRKTTFKGFSGRDVESAGELERYGFKVGDRLRYAGVNAIDEVKGAKSLEIVGFTKIWDTFNGDIILQVDGEYVFRCNEEIIKREFEKM
ncbi:MAG: AAA family ATPase [bacterium]|nr:AAA family ATPase [bacterium]